MRKKNHQTSSLLGKCSSLPRWSTLSSWRLERVTRLIFKKGSVQPCLHSEKSALRTRTTSKLLIIKDCLKKLENLPKDAIIVAETYYQLGVAQGFNAQHDEASRV